MNNNTNRDFSIKHFQYQLSFNCIFSYLRFNVVILFASPSQLGATNVLIFLPSTREEDKSEEKITTFIFWWWDRFRWNHSKPQKILPAWCVAKCPRLFCLLSVEIFSFRTLLEINGETSRQRWRRRRRQISEWSPPGGQYKCPRTNLLPTWCGGVKGGIGVKSGQKCVLRRLDSHGRCLCLYASWQ